MAHHTVCIASLFAGLVLLSHIATAQPVWERMDAPATSVIAEAPDGSIVTSGEGWLYRSTDNGGSWTRIEPAFGGDLVGIDSAGRIYGYRTSRSWFPGDYDTTITKSLYQSSDTGRTWQYISGPEGFDQIDLSQPGLLAAGFVGRVYVDGPGAGNINVSRDGGATWQASTLGTSSTEIAVTPRGSILANSHMPESYTAGGTLFLSRDSGSTWRNAVDSFEVGILTVAPDGTIYLVGRRIQGDTIEWSSTLLRSIDDGESWETVLDSGYVRTMFVTSSGIHLSIGFDSYRPSPVNLVSTDKGASWMQPEPRHPYFEPRYLQELPDGDIIATGYDTLFRSRDNGLAWQSIHFNLPLRPNLSIGATLASRSGYLFVSMGGALYRATLDAAGVSEHHLSRSSGIRIESPRPEPVTTTSIIPLVLASPLQLRVVLCDLLGRELHVIYDGLLPAGSSVLELERGELPAGSYLLVVRSANGVESRVVIIQ